MPTPVVSLPALTYSRSGRSSQPQPYFSDISEYREWCIPDSMETLVVGFCHEGDKVDSRPKCDSDPAPSPHLTARYIRPSLHQDDERMTWLEPLDQIMTDSIWDNPFAGLCPVIVAEDPASSLDGESAKGLLLSHDPEFEVTWAKDGSDIPMNWPAWYRGLTLAFITFGTLVVVMASTMYSPGIPGVMTSFGVQNRTIPVLGVTSYLFGLAFGPLILSPLSEMYGGRPVYIGSLFLFAVLLIPSAVAQNLATIIATRFFAALVGSVMVSNAPGTLNAIADKDMRALYFSVWIIGAVNGPVIGPIFGGIIFQYLGWRWIQGILIILAFTACGSMACVKETQPSAILGRRCKALKRKDARYWSIYDRSSQITFWARLKSSMSKPVAMIIREPTCLFWDIYVSIIYAMLYLCVVGYPIVFSGIRGWGPAVSGLPFLGMGLGSVISLAAEPQIRRLTKAFYRFPDNSPPPPEAMLPIVIFGSVLIPIGQLFFALSAAPPNSAAIPILSGVPLGIGNTLVFVYVTNYLATCYGSRAASALAGNASMRYMAGGLFPLLAPVMYSKLGPLVSGVILTVALSLLVIMPVWFWISGDRLRREVAPSKEEIDF